MNILKKSIIALSISIASIGATQAFDINRALDQRQLLTAAAAAPSKASFCSRLNGNR